jgi:hypothetical protein
MSGTFAERHDRVGGSVVLDILLLPCNEPIYFGKTLSPQLGGMLDLIRSVNVGFIEASFE